MGRSTKEILKELADEVWLNNNLLKSPDHPNHDPMPANIKDVLVEVNLHMLCTEDEKGAYSAYLLSKLVSVCEYTKHVMVFENDMLVFKKDWMLHDLEATWYGAVWYMG